MTETTAVTTTIVVDAPVDRAFSVFTDDIGKLVAARAPHPAGAPGLHGVRAEGGRSRLRRRDGRERVPLGARARLRAAAPRRVQLGHQPAVAGRDGSRQGRARSRCGSSPRASAAPGSSSSTATSTATATAGRAMRDAVGSPEGWGVGPAALRRTASRWHRSPAPRLGGSSRALLPVPAARDVRAGRSVHAAHHDRPVGLQLDAGFDHHSRMAHCCAEVSQLISIVSPGGASASMARRTSVADSSWRAPRVTIALVLGDGVPLVPVEEEPVPRLGEHGDDVDGAGRAAHRAVDGADHLELALAHLVGLVAVAPRSAAPPRRGAWRPRPPRQGAA